MTRFLKPALLAITLAAISVSANAEVFNPPTANKAGNGITVSSPTGNSTISTTVTPNTQTGTTYPIVSTDGGKTVEQSNASAIADTIVAASTTGFTSGFATQVQNIGTAGQGAVTITATTSVFDNGLNTLICNLGQTCFFISDSVNYHSVMSLPVCLNNQYLGNTSGATNYPVCVATPSVVTWPTSGDIVISSGTNTPTGVVPGTGVLTALAAAVSGTGSICLSSGSACAGTGTPGGANTNVQYNNSSAFGGSSAINLTATTATFPTAGASSATPYTFTGAPFSGTGTTATPLVNIGGGAAASSWSTTGTLLGFNPPTGFTGNIMDAHVPNGGTSVFLVSYLGGVVVTTGGSYGFSGEGRLAYPAANIANFQTNAGNTVLTRLDFGLNTSSGPALCTAGTTITTCLGDGTAGGNLTVGGYLQLSAPTSPSCGTGCASVTGNDQKFVVTPGTAQTSVIVNFGHTFGAIPVCTLASSQNASVIDIASISATSITFGASIAVTGGSIYVICA